ncbi:MAG: hypothetical protein GXO26_08320 [Crenarchaeota archaeon]|nr:hypothetical protein [Thermoproteota archaeon]
MRRSLLILLSLIAVIAITVPAYAACTKATFKYGTKLLNVTAHYCAKGKCGTVSIEKGNVTIPVTYPVNISFTYNGVLYVVEVKANSTVIDISKLPYCGNITSNIAIHGVLLKNTETSLTIDKSLKLCFNAPVSMVLPEATYSPPFGMYKLENVSTSGDVKYISSSREVVFDGSGTAKVNYKTVAIFGIPFIYILLGVAIVLILIAIVAKRGTIMSRKSRKMFNFS